jgi:hypothetical protein
MCETAQSRDAGRTASILASRSRSGPVRAPLGAKVSKGFRWSAGGDSREKRVEGTKAFLAWGWEVAPRYVRLVYANELRERLRGIGERVRSAL